MSTSEGVFCGRRNGLRNLISASLVLMSAAQICNAGWNTLMYQPAPIDNPLKGLVPYQGDVRDRFPHSMEFNYLPYAALVKGYNVFDWEPLEKLLEDIRSRGHQAVLRVYLEYPGKKDGIPEFLVRDGLRVHTYLNHEAQPPSAVSTPDYEDEHLRRSLRQFISAFGKRYDGDARIGFITAGLLGAWGEWHTYPREELFASKTVQNEVMDSYEAAFKETRILLRYPVGASDGSRAANANRPFGYHDDSFAWATLPTGRADDNWFYLAMLKNAGGDAKAKWKRQPIGGEIRPEAWGKVFDEVPSDRRIQDFERCVKATHVSWLMDSGMFRRRAMHARKARAELLIRAMGYELYCPRVFVGTPKNGQLEVRLEIENRGVAPFYYDWKAEWGIFQGKQKVKTYPATLDLTKLLPHHEPHTRRTTLDVGALGKGLLHACGSCTEPHGRWCFVAFCQC